MELRHLRYFAAVGEALSFTGAAARLRIAQSALSRQVQDLEHEIGVNLLRRGPRGVTLTAEGRFFLEQVRELLKRTNESIEKVRSLANGGYSELRVGYAPTLAVEVLPPGVEAFRKSMPRANLSLHDLSSEELVAGLRNGTLELAIMAQTNGDHTVGIEFEVLRSYPMCVALAATHPFARLKSVPLQRIAAEPLIGMRRHDYPEYYPDLERLFASIGAKPRIAVECDSTSSLLIEVEAGHGIALCLPIFEHVTGKRLLYRPITGTTKTVPIGIARATDGDLTPAGAKFCAILREIFSGATAAKPNRNGLDRLLSANHSVGHDERHHEPTADGQYPHDSQN
jgi:DNA-binding transcriptional LysR family regulator